VNGFKINIKHLYVKRKMIWMTINRFTDKLVRYIRFSRSFVSKFYLSLYYIADDLSVERPNFAIEINALYVIMNISLSRSSAAGSNIITRVM